MTDVVVNILLVLLFVLIGGVFAAAEMAFVTLRDSQIRQLSSRGKRGLIVQKLTEDPNRFLSAVQVGVTMMGFLGASFGGATLQAPLARLLSAWGIGAGLADILALVIVTVLISFISIVLGELAAKRLAMQRAETLALLLAPLVDFIATIARPLIWLLGVCSNLVVRALGGDPNASKEEVSGEELRAMMSTMEHLGVEERQILDDVFEAGERSLREVMIPRTEVDFLSGDMPAGKAARFVRDAPRSRYPVNNGSHDEIVGFLHVRDLMDLDTVARQTPVAQMARPILSLPETVKVLRALSDMRKAKAHLAIVVDEYGGTAGIVTLEDLVEELIGDITDEYDVEDDALKGGSNEIGGLTSLEDFADMTGYELPEGPYDTVAGYIMAKLGHLPQLGDQVVVELDPEEESRAQGTFELVVTELDGRRVARVKIRRV